MQESLISNPILSAIAITLIHFIWQGGIIALTLKALLACYQQPQVRYVLASITMLFCLCLPVSTFLLVYDNTISPLTDTANTHLSTATSLSFTQQQSTAWFIDLAEYLPHLSAAWLVIVVILALKLLLELYNVNRLPLENTQLASKKLQLRFEQLISKIGLSEKIKLVVSTTTNVPMAIGCFRPIVLIPISMLSGLTPHQLDLLLLHELAHIKRHDYLVNFMQTLVEILFFYHPCVYWISKQMRNEREYCSDDMAIALGGDAITYAHTLADTASLCQHENKCRHATMAMAASGGDLKQRVIRLIDGQHHHCIAQSPLSKSLASLTVLSGFILCCSLSLFTIKNYSTSDMIYNDDAIKTHEISSLTFEDTQPKNDFPVFSSTIDNHVQRKTATRPTGIQPKTEQTTKSSAYDQQSSLSQHQTAKLDQLSAMNRRNHEKSTETILHELQQQISDKTQSDNTLTSAFNEPETNNRFNTAKINDVTNHLANKEQYVEQTKAITQDYVENTQLSNSKDNETQLNQHNDNSRDLTSATLIKYQQPKYPKSAKRRGIEIDLQVDFDIDKNGLVKNIVFEDNIKSRYFKNVIRNAMSTWRFIPAEKNGQAINSKMTKIFSFSLK